MKYLAICEDDLLFQFMRKLATRRGEVLFLVEEESVARRIRRQGGSSQWARKRGRESFLDGKAARAIEAVACRDALAMPAVD